MSEFRVEVVEIGSIDRHPNADTLGLTLVHDYPVIVKLGDFQPGDRAAYVPVDSVVPADDARWAFLAGRYRIKAKRLRGIFSMGLLTPADPSWELGRDVREELRIIKYEPPESFSMGGEDESDPGFMPVYTDIEGLRRWPDVILPGEEVVITEKIHGSCARYCFSDGRLWVGSRTRIKRESDTNLWWKVAHKLDLAGKLSIAKGIAVYGEVYGPVQDLTYGVGRSETARIALFDALDCATRRYLDFDEFERLAERLGLPTVPILYRGGWSNTLRSLAEGPTTIMTRDPHVREGIVVRLARERWDSRIGRVILKLHGEGYLTR